MSKIGLRNRVGRLNRKKIIIGILALAVIAAGVFGGIRIFGGNEHVEFRVLAESKISHHISYNYFRSP